jgi:hypothetical protein
MTFPRYLQGYGSEMGRRCLRTCTNACCASLPGYNSSIGRAGRWRMSAPDASVRRSPLLLSRRGGNCWRSRGSAPISLYSAIDDSRQNYYCAPGGMRRMPSDVTCRPPCFICRRIVATTTRETICGANSDDIGRTNCVTSLRRVPTRLLEKVASCSRYQLNSHTEAERLPKVVGNRKSSAAANSHGVLWKRACAEKNLSGRRG